MKAGTRAMKIRTEAEASIHVHMWARPEGITQHCILCNVVRVHIERGGWKVIDVDRRLA